MKMVSRRPEQPFGIRAVEHKLRLGRLQPLLELLDRLGGRNLLREGAADPPGRLTQLFANLLGVVTDRGDRRLVVAAELPYGLEQLLIGGVP
jgi:hypothetical protein